MIDRASQFFSDMLPESDRLSCYRLHMSEYDKEKWVELYRAALLELEHAKMTGRIGNARTEIAARIEKLHDIPGLHAKERQAIEDALNSLRSLEREEERYAADERRVAETALEKLRFIAPRVENPYAK